MNVLIAPISESDLVSFRECLDVVARERKFLALIEAQIHVDGRSAVDVIEDARTYRFPSDVTDMASIPPFMRWFVNNYGRHSLAAIIHDRLITDGAPNSGVLGSDSLSDCFFREMMGVAGVPWLKRWIMWSAVAMRTRWAARGWRS